MLRARSLCACLRWDERLHEPPVHPSLHFPPTQRTCARVSVPGGEAGRGRGMKEENILEPLQASAGEGCSWDQVEGPHPKEGAGEELLRRTELREDPRWAWGQVWSYRPLRTHQLQGDLHCGLAQALRSRPGRYRWPGGTAESLVISLFASGADPEALRPWHPPEQGEDGSPPPASFSVTAAPPCREGPACREATQEHQLHLLL